MFNDIKDSFYNKDEIVKKKVKFLVNKILNNNIIINS